MKAPSFDYTKPKTLDAVFAALAEYGDEAQLLAGGQTLIATLNMRLSEPAMLIDINGVDLLRGIALTNAGNTLRLGALVRHSEIEDSALIKQHAPLLALAVPYIAHRAIRNLGTFGGSIAYADPAAEWPTCLVALNGTVIVRSSKGERRIAADDFFTDLYTTALVPGEIIVACEIPVQQQSGVALFNELARRHGDYAICGLAVTGTLLVGQLNNPRMVYLGIGTTPIRALQSEALLQSEPLSVGLIDEIQKSLKQELDPLGDLTNTSATKKHLATVLAKRLLQSLLGSESTKNLVQSAHE